MADCVSLPNAAEILKNIRWMYADEYWVQIAADAIEQLVSKCNQLEAENAKLKAELNAARVEFSSVCDANAYLCNRVTKLKAERDAAVSDLKSIAPCQKCKHCGVNQMTCDALEKCLYGEAQMWEWRGINER